MTNLNKKCLHDTIRSTELLIKVVQGNSNPLVRSSELGFHGLSMSIYQENLDFMKNIGPYLVPYGNFHNGIISNLKIVNELFFANYQDKFGNSIDLTPPCALIIFPVLEEVTRVISGYWNEDGILLRPIIESDGIIEWASDRNRIIKRNAGSRINSLESKFQLMMKMASPKTKELINYIDDRYKIPSISGLKNPICSTLSSKIYFWRNRWLHGERQDGYEAILISHLIMLIYFGELYKEDP